LLETGKLAVEKGKAIILNIYNKINKCEDKLRTLKINARTLTVKT
jgi:hypothetical protein